jgi:hypothetical protein
MTERRTARRYDLSLPVSIRFPIDRDSSPHTGKTRDISTRGVYLTIDSDISQGTELDLTMTLPAEVTGGTEVFIRAVGRVVRVEKGSDTENPRLGVAAVIERYEIVRNEALAS